MSVDKGICTHYVSEIDELFHAPDRPSGKLSPAREREINRAERIARLRDKSVATTPLPASDLWEDF